jgi:hypothetical protein
LRGAALFRASLLKKHTRVQEMPWSNISAIRCRRELDVLAFLLAVTVKVPVEVGTVLSVALTALAPILVAALDIFHLVMPILGRVEALVFVRGCFSLAHRLLLIPSGKLCLYAGLESLKFCGFR